MTMCEQPGQLRKVSLLLQIKLGLAEAKAASGGASNCLLLSEAAPTEVCLKLAEKTLVRSRLRGSVEHSRSPWEGGAIRE